MPTKTASFFCFALLADLLTAQDWPMDYRPPKNLGTHTVTTDGTFRYQSRSYRIVAFKTLDPQLITGFITCAESVPAALRTLPLPLSSPPPAGKAVIKIIPTEELYLQSGGAPNTAGFYDGRSNTALFQWPHFFRKPETNKLLPKPSFDLVVHELTHLSMDGLIWKSETWFIEGVAEYLSAAHLGKGHFQFQKIDQAIIRRLKKHSAPNATKIQLPALSSLLQMTSRDWLASTAGKTPWEALELYNASLLLVHYAFHGGEKRRTEVKSHLERLHHIKDRRTARPPLFPANSASKIEKALTTYWATKGLTLSFRDSP